MRHLQAGLRLILAAIALLPCSLEKCPADETDKTTSGHFTQPMPDEFPDLYLWTDTCNVWVLRNGDSALLVDFGDGSLVPHLPQIGVQRIERILLTHHHREQCQGLLRNGLVDAPVSAPLEEKALFETPSEFRRWYPTLGDPFSVYGASYVRPLSRPLKVAEYLKDGQVLRWNDHEIRCTSTPGHSPGSMSYLILRNGRKFAFTGDLMHDGSNMVTWFDSEWDYGFGRGIDTLLSSVSRLMTARPDVLLPSHGPIIRRASNQLTRYQQKLVEFRAGYVRGYPVFDSTEQDRDSISRPTAVPLISKVTPHLYKLSHQTQGRNFAIIVSDSGKGLILDCGLLPESQLEEIIAGMRAHLGLKEIDAFWISHMHGDHFLLGPVLREKHGAQAWTMDRIVDRCENPRFYDYAAMVSAYSDGFDGMKIDRALKDGEKIEWEGMTLQVDWMPGQTEFGCCLWLDLDGKRIAFTGDNLFGNSQSPEQDGHEAVVARNSAIIEEGYLYAAEYLKKLQPDIIMGSHSYVMQDPAAFIERYHEWSGRIIQLYENLLPTGMDYEYLFDPYWVSAYPYRVDLSAASTAQVFVTLRNFRDQPQKYHVELQLPAGMRAEPAVLDATVEARSRMRIPVTLTVDHPANLQDLELIPFDITRDGIRQGQLFDFLVRIRPASRPSNAAAEASGRQ